MPKNFAFVNTPATTPEPVVGPQGPRGQQGQQGIPGPQGPQGPQGDNVLTHASGGVLFKPMTTKQRVGIKNPPVGLAVFDIDTNKIFVNTSTGWCACGSAPRKATTSS